MAPPPTPHHPNPTTHLRTLRTPRQDRLLAHHLHRRQPQPPPQDAAMHPLPQLGHHHRNTPSALHHRTVAHRPPAPTSHPVTQVKALRVLPSSQILTQLLESQDSAQRWTNPPAEPAPSAPNPGAPPSPRPAATAPPTHHQPGQDQPDGGASPRTGSAPAPGSSAGATTAATSAVAEPPRSTTSTPATTTARRTSRPSAPRATGPSRLARAALLGPAEVG